MEDARRHARLGLFIVTSAVVLLAAVFALVGREWWSTSFTFETYFNNSIAGLELGAPVRFRGVPLGQVTQILTSAATYERDVPLNRRREYIVVRVKVNVSAQEAQQMRRDAAALTRRGLRAQTQLAGITGQQYLSLDFMDARRYPPLEFEWTPQYTYLPSAPSSVGEIVSKAQSFLASLNDADIRALGQNLNRLVSDVDTKLGQLPLTELSGSAKRVLGNANTTLEGINRLLATAPLGHTLVKLDSAATHVDALVADPALERLLTGMDDAAERLDGVLDDNQPDIRGIVQDLRVTADNLRVLSNNLRRDPASVLLGGPPPQVQLSGGAP